MVFLRGFFHDRDAGACTDSVRTGCEHFLYIGISSDTAGGFNLQGITDGLLHQLHVVYSCAAAAETGRGFHKGRACLLCQLAGEDDLPSSLAASTVRPLRVTNSF